MSLKDVINENITLEGSTKEERYQFNKLIRLQIITNLENEILFDMRVCQIEEWDHREFIRMIREMLDKLPH